MDAAQEAEVERQMAIQAYQYCRDICSWGIHSPLLLGGPGVTVQIGVSLFRHKPKVSSLMKLLGVVDTIMVISCFQNHRGCPPQWDVWVFGMCDTSQTPALGVIRMVSDQTAATLHCTSNTVSTPQEWDNSSQ